MTDLRADLIEALDEAITNDGYWYLPAEQITKGLDAILDVLAARTDEWEADYWGPSWATDEDGRYPYEEGKVPAIAARLLAVLREDT